MLQVVRTHSHCFQLQQAVLSRSHGLKRALCKHSSCSTAVTPSFMRWSKTWGYDLEDLTRQTPFLVLKLVHLPEGPFALSSYVYAPRKLVSAHFQRHQDPTHESQGLALNEMR